MFYLDVAGVVFVVEFSVPEWQALLIERYAAFGGPAGLDRRAWHVTVAQDPSLAITDSPWISHDGPVTTFRMLDQIGRFDLAGRRAEISVPSVMRAASGLDRMLSYVCMQALPREHDGLLLHAVGVVLDGAGRIFTGASGAGKTTIARLAAGHGAVLSDENVIMRLGPGGAELCSTPFWGHSTPPEMIRRTNRRIRLAGVYLLEHAPQFRLARLSPAEAVMALLTTEKVATERTDSAGAWLTVAGRLVDQVPVFRLGFRPTTELWHFLAGDAAG